MATDGGCVVVVFVVGSRNSGFVSDVELLVHVCPVRSVLSSVVLRRLRRDGAFGTEHRRAAIAATVRG